jgi:hypothetical protein
VRAQVTEMLQVHKSRCGDAIQFRRYKHIFIIDITGLSMSKHFGKKVWRVEAMRVRRCVCGCV